MADTTNYEITKEEWDYIYETWKNKPEIDMKFALGAAERRGYEQGFREGIAQGIAEGITEQLVQRALQRGRSIEFIMDEFDVSKEYVLSIQKSQ